LYLQCTPSITLLSVCIVWVKKAIHVFLIKLIQRTEPKFLQMLQSGWASRWDMIINMQNVKKISVPSFHTFNLRPQVESSFFTTSFGVPSHPNKTESGDCIRKKYNTSEVQYYHNVNPLRSVKVRVVSNSSMSQWQMLSEGRKVTKKAKYTATNFTFDCIENKPKIAGVLKLCKLMKINVWKQTIA
jgi:hypothetical protein